MKLTPRVRHPWILSTFIMVAGLLFASPSCAGITWIQGVNYATAGAGFIQSKSATTGYPVTDTSVAVTLNTVVSSGDTVAGFVSWGSPTTSTLTSVTDDKGNTYTIVRRTTSGAFNQSFASFYLQNITNNPTTITANFSSTFTWRAIAVHEISGLTATPLDKETGQLQTSAGTGANAVTSGSVTTTASLDYIIAGTTEGSSSEALPMYQAGTGYTKREEVGSTSTQNLATEDQIQASAGAISGTFTQAFNDQTLTHIMTFKGAGGSTSITSPVLPQPILAGDLIVVTTRAPNGTLTVTDNQGQTYSLATGPTNNHSIYYKANSIAVPANTLAVTVTTTGTAGTMRVFVDDFSGAATSNVLDTTSAITAKPASNGCGTTIADSPPAAGNGELVYAAGGMTNTSTYTACPVNGATMTIGSQTSASGTGSMFSAYALNSLSGAQNVAINEGSFCGGCLNGGVAVFKPICTYNFRKSITVNSSQVIGGPLTNYPLLVNFTDANLKVTGSGGNVTSAFGYDIIFTASDGITKLNHEIETYTSTTGQLVAWVGVPSINTGTVVYMYYGNSCVTSPTQNPTAVWDANFKAVWHLQQSGNGTAGEFKDSTSNANNGQGGAGSSAATPTQAAGEIGFGQNFNGSQYIQVPDTASLDETTQLTMEAWVKLPTPTANQKIMGKTDTSHTRGYLLSVTTGGLYTEIWDSAGTDYTFTSGGTLAANTWTHLAVTWTTSGNMIGYINGVQVNSIADGSNNIGTGGTTPKLAMGVAPWNTSSFYLTGGADEVRISNTARSANWLKTEANNLSAPGSFYAVGGQEGPANLNAYETATYKGAVSGFLNTKIAGQTASLDIIALTASSGTTVIDTSSTWSSRQIKVEVIQPTSTTFDANHCPTTYNSLNSTNVTFPSCSSPNCGRATFNIAMPANSYPNARLRMSYPTSSPTAIGCSTDNFAIRPNSFTSTGTILGVPQGVLDADWQTAGTTRTLNLLDFTTTPQYLHKAGRPFSVRSTALASDGTTTTTNYAGTPTATLTQCLGAACTATFGTLTLSTAFAAGLLASDVATYDNVGAFAVQLIDSTFSSVDNLPGDTPANCTGQYICGSTLNAGRFVPDHFDFSPNLPQFGTACGSFTYVGQPFNYTTAPVMTVTARNFAGSTTTLYAGSWFRITNGSLTGKSYTAATGTVNWSGVPGTDPVIVSTGAGTGTLTFASGTGLFFNRTTPTATFNADISLGVNVIDADGAAYASNPASFGTATLNNGIAFNISKSMYFGQLAIGNALGSGLLNLPISIQTQYWNGTSFVTNTLDSCTTITAGNISLSNYQGGLTSGNLPSGNISISGAFNAGVGNLTLTKPSSAVNGTVDMTVGLGAAGMSYLQGAWAGPTYTYDPLARAAFGFSKGSYSSGSGSDAFVYQRENY